MCMCIINTINPQHVEKQAKTQKNGEINSIPNALLVHHKRAWKENNM